jgi:cyclophilin family peptidyl-prolyl cis-trans isomerase
MKKRSNKKRLHRRSRRHNSLDFECLEPRQLLAGDVTAMHQVQTNLPPTANLVVNGDFEDYTPGDDRFYDESEVLGWQALNASGGQQFNIMNYGLDYESALDLDSTPAQFDAVYQEIATTPGSEYLIAFDFRGHPSENGVTPTERTFDFEVWWNQERVAVYTGDRFWETGTVLVTGGSGNTTELLFCEVEEGPRLGGDGLGAVLDHIRVVEAELSPVTNGSFEQTVAADGQLFHTTEVEGWGAMTPVVSERLLKIEQADTAAEFRATHGNRFLNLDTSDSHRDVIWHDFETVAGATYYVTLDMRADGELSYKADEIRVQWNNDWASTMYAGSNWQNYGLMLKADSSQSRLMFLEPGDGNHGDGSGPWIDNVQLIRVKNLPPQIEQVTFQSAEFATPFSLDVAATDPENQPISYEISHDGILLGHQVPTISQTGQINWTPSHAGIVELTVTATDAWGASEEMSFAVNVAAFEPFAGTGVLANIDPELRNGIYSAPPPMTIDNSKTYEAQFVTSQGDFTIRLYDDLAPLTVNNFVSLANDGFYEGLEFFRVINGFMGQSGDPENDGSGGPGYTFADETSNGLIFDQPNLIAMANTGSASTNGSQFFVTFGTPTHLNGDHTVFGEIIGDNNAFESTTVTRDVFDNPLPNVEPTIIHSISIVVT